VLWTVGLILLGHAIGNVGFIRRHIEPLVLLIVLLSVPTFPAVFWAVKSLAPTQLRLAGAVAGLLASSTATIVYCLHCPEMSPAFWSVWYAIGMLLPAGIGAWLGPKLLRW